MDCNMPDLPAHHQLPEHTQTYVHRVGDAIQPSHPLLSPSPLAFSLPASGSFQMSQFFTSGGQSTRVSASASVLQWVFRTDFLEDGLVGSPCSPRSSQESSPTPQFKSINSSSVLSFLYSPTLTRVSCLFAKKIEVWIKIECLDRKDFGCMV